VGLPDDFEGSGVFIEPPRPWNEPPKVVTPWMDDEGEQEAPEPAAPPQNGEPGAPEDEKSGFERSEADLLDFGISVEEIEEQTRIIELQTEIERCRTKQERGASKWRCQLCACRESFCFLIFFGVNFVVEFIF
jgi:uncharacterized small protein (DUF1192 family)